MTDMTPAAAPKADQLNFDDFVSGITKTIKVTKVSLNPSSEQKTTINYEGDAGKPYKPGKSMVRVLIHCWGRDGRKWEGRSMTLYGDPTVKFGADTTGGIRISHLSDISSEITMALTATRGKRKPFTVKPLAEEASTQPDMNPADIPEAGKEAASKGTAHYNAWCNARTAADKVHIKPLHPEWKKLAAEVDAQGVEL